MTCLLDGENLSRRGDVVVVSLNHRLNLLGFIDLSTYGEKYAKSGNVGMLDIVTGARMGSGQYLQFRRRPGTSPDLRPVRRRSEGEHVDGNARRLWTVSPRRRAKRILWAQQYTGRSQKLADMVVKELRLSAATVDRIQSLPYADLRRAGETVLSRVNPPFDPVTNIRKMAAALNFGPVIDGSVLPSKLFDGKAPAVSEDVPMIIGTTLNEFANGMNNPNYKLMTEEALIVKTKSIYADRAEKVISAFRQRTPEAMPYELWSRIASAPIRQAAVKQAAAKTALDATPAFLYWFMWQTPIFDGRPQAFHYAELPFVFYNTDRYATMTGGGPDARALGGKIADAWINFARTGDPNHGNIPSWPKFSSGTVPTMIFGIEVHTALNPDAVELKSIA